MFTPQISQAGEYINLQYGTGVLAVNADSAFTNGTTVRFYHFQIFYSLGLQEGVLA